MVVVSHLFLLCAECGTNLTGESSVTGVCRKPQTDISNAKDQRSDGVMFIDIYNYEFKNLSVSRLKKRKLVFRQ